MSGNNADLVDIQPDNSPPNLQQSILSTTKVVFRTHKCTNLGDGRFKGCVHDDLRSKQNFCDACWEEKRLARDAYSKKAATRKKRENNKIQKLAHDRAVSKRDHELPEIKEDNNSVSPVMELVMDSKVTTLIIDQSQYKVLKRTLPFLSHVIAARTVAHKKLTAVRNDKS